MVGLLWAIGQPEKALAQETPIKEQSLIEAYALPSIHVTAIDAKEVDGIVSGNFTVKNSENDSFGDLQYQIMLLGPAPTPIPGKVVFDTASLYDRYVLKPIFDIAGKSEKKIDFSYTIPKLPNGDYRMRIQLITAKGVELGWRDMPVTVGAEANETKMVQIEMVGASIDGKAIDPERLDGFNIEPSKQITLDYFAQNDTGKEVIATPTLGIWEFSKNRETVDSLKGASVTLKKGYNSFLLLSQPQ